MQLKAGLTNQYENLQGVVKKKSPPFKTTSSDDICCGMILKRWFA